MELKARPGKYDDATQLARYKDALDRLGERNVIMWLVAPQISNSVREFLDRIGIEYTEIHESEFRRVADRHGITTQAGAGVSGDANPAPSMTFASVDRVNRPRESNSTPSPIETGPAVTAPSPLRWSSRGYDLVLVNRDALDSQKFASLIDSFEDAVPSRRKCAGGRQPASLGRRCSVGPASQ
jgi:hypothetical protein